MSGTTSRGYTLDELAQAFGVDEQEAAEILDEHGYRVTSSNQPLTLSADEYIELMEAAPLDPDGEQS